MLLTTLLALILVYLYLKPNFDYDYSNDKLFIHYNWRGVRKTYIL